MEKYLPLPDADFLSVHGELSLECGFYKSGCVDEEVDGDVMLEVTNLTSGVRVAEYTKRSEGRWVLHRDEGPAHIGSDGRVIYGLNGSITKIFLFGRDIQY